MYPRLPYLMTEKSIRLDSSPVTRPVTIPPALLRHYFKPALVTLICLFCTWYTLSYQDPGIPPSYHTFASNATPSHGLPNSEDAFEFWNGFTTALEKGKLSFDEVKYLQNVEEDNLLFKTTPEDRERLERIDLGKKEVDELREAHEHAVRDFRTLGPKLPFVRGTRGIVTTAAMDAMAILTTSLRMLRNAGSQLPVEVWVSTNFEYEESVYMCEEVFPQLGASCKVMSDYLPEVNQSEFKIKDKFMYKLDALLFSTFEQVLFLDCDLFPVVNPDSIFVTEPFVSRGFVLWPDHWASTTSKVYYDIVGRKPVPITERQTTESGALLINKNTHAEALLLAAFYNYWGPKIYYRLFTQGAQGEGDKDTFLPAIETYGLPYYQVAEPAQRIGYRCNGHPRHIASGQMHPRDDFAITSHGIWRNHGDVADMTDTAPPRLLFIHGNLPKYEVPTVLDWRMEDFDWLDMLRCDKGTGQAHRLWGPKELSVPRFGWDVEKALWDAMRWTACEHEQGVRKWVNGTIYSKPRLNVCRDIVAFYEELLPDETYDPRLTVYRKEAPWGMESGMY